ncbi:MAG: helix-turn-helix domain-containing protein [Candidatus Marinimicrobia bacterium]|nr:helix-turn-helix domain-containing protein [Candidatus Neomarinimicrobiota bacterium]
MATGERNIAEEIERGLKEIRDNPKKLKRYEFTPVDVKAIREAFNMSQSQLATFMAVSIDTLQNWEQGRRNPRGPAQALLRIMQHEPEAVMRALHT